MIYLNPTLNDFAEKHPLRKDTQEAESRRYARGFMILPLDSGRLAVLGHLRSLHAICDTFEEALEAAKSIPSKEEVVRRIAKKESQTEELERLLGL